MAETESTVAGTFPRGFSKEQPPVWPMVRADSIVELRYGRALTESARRVGQVPVYGTNGRTGWHDDALASGPGVILGRKGMGNLGVEWCFSDFWVIDTAYYVRARTDQLDLRYFYYLISYIGLNHLKDGTSNPSLSRDTFSAQLLPFPPRDAQIAIAATLSELDDKIEQNRRTLVALESLARATFKAWFVDFEPIKAKADGQTSFPGMSPAAFAALPDRLIDSPIGAVPEGWAVRPLKETVKLTMGQSPSSEFYNLTGDGLPFHQGVSDHGFRFPTRRVYCTAEGRMACAGDVLLSVRAPVGRINVADVRMLLGRGLAGMRHRQGKQSFLLYLMQHHFAEDDAVGDGTIYKSVNKDFVEAMPLITPGPETLQAFEGIAVPMDAMISSLTEESSKLATLRDYLLRRLLNGQVRVHPSLAEVKV